MLSIESGNRSHLSDSATTQRGFQLRAIVDTLNRIEQAHLAAPEQAAMRSQLHLQIAEHAITVRLATADQLIDTRALVLAPLFAGSHTQPEVAACKVDSDNLHVTDLSNRSTAALHPLDPRLHFAQFKSLPRALDGLLNRSTQKLVVLVAAETDLTDNRERILPTTQELSTLIDSPTDLEIVVIDLQTAPQTHTLKAFWPQLQRRWQLHEHFRQVRAKVKIVTLSAVDSTTLMTVLSQAQYAFASSAGLAMDALNAGCRLIGQAPGTAIGSQQDSHDKAAARLGMAQAQQIKLEADEVLYGVAALQSLIGDWLQPEGWARHQITDHLSPIIPLNTRAPNPIRSTMASARAKLRKLHHSPRQFFQDSRYSALRRLVRS